MPDEQAAFPGLGTDPARSASGVEAMERVLERLFVIPGTQQPVGLDVILDLVPVVGDIAAAALGAYIVWEANNLGMSKWQIARMAGNVGVDWLLGLIPCGRRRIPDFFFRSNTRNLRIIKRHLDKHHAADRDVEATGDPRSVAAGYRPDMNAFDLVLDRRPSGIGRRAEAEALDDQAAGQVVEFGTPLEASPGSGSRARSRRP